MIGASRTADFQNKKGGRLVGWPARKMFSVLIPIYKHRLHSFFLANTSLKPNDELNPTRVYALRNPVTFS
jgi:hypothetical protein